MKTNHQIKCDTDSNSDRFYECDVSDAAYKKLNDLVITLKDNETGKDDI